MFETFLRIFQRVYYFNRYCVTLIGLANREFRIIMYMNLIIFVKHFFFIETPIKILHILNLCNLNVNFFPQARVSFISRFLCIYICCYVYIYIYTHIYREREFFKLINT